MNTDTTMGSTSSSMVSTRRPARSLTSLPDIVIDRILYFSDQQDPPFYTPIRRGPMYILPLPVWRPTVCLSSTCRRIRRLASRFLFYVVRIPVDKEGLDFANWLDENAERRLLVRIVELSCSPSGLTMSTTDYIRFELALIRLLTGLSNLEKVFAYGSVSFNLLGVLTLLPLKDLTLVKLSIRYPAILVRIRNLERLDLSFQGEPGAGSLSNVMCEGEIMALWTTIVNSCTTLLDLGISFPMEQSERTVGADMLGNTFFPSHSPSIVNFPRLTTLSIESPYIPSNFFSKLANAAPNLEYIFLPLDEIAIVTPLEIPPASFPNLVELEVGLPPSPTLWGIEQLVRGKKKLGSLALRVSEAEVMSILEATRESTELEELDVSNVYGPSCPTTSSLLRQVATFLPELVIIEIESIPFTLPAEEGGSTFGYSDIPSLLSSLYWLSILVFKNAVLDPFPLFDNFVEALANPSSSTFTTDDATSLLDELEERDLPRLVPACIPLFEELSGVVEVRWEAYERCWVFRKGRGKRFWISATFEVENVPRGMDETFFQRNIRLVVKERPEFLAALELRSDRRRLDTNNIDHTSANLTH
ncbi:hypothetical protein BDY24DRAFT_378834 [Mrakia frigida]|uniref:uncharacterized protein n=1 Tax=Mrakia frigida TaxID=29902 RepID=UPI003FCC2430